MIPRMLLNTLIINALFLVALSTTSNALGHTSGGVSRREHDQLKRFIKKRQLDGLPAGIGLGGTNGAGNDPPTFFNSTSSVVVSSSTESSSSSGSSSASSSGSSSSSVASSSSSVESLSSSSSSSAKAVSTSSSSQASETTPIPSNTSRIITTKTDTVEAASVTEGTNNKPTGALDEEDDNNTWLIVLIVVASSVGGAALIWTIFRKWKLARSSKFDKRLQPIDWQPTTSNDFAAAHSRRGSDGASFRSESDSRKGYGATSESGHSQPLGPLPDHDFTAGSTSLAPIGGYADLARGSSPVPQMTEARALSPAMAHNHYDAGLPLHHQSGYAFGGSGGKY